jgi:tetratricopeptide (TPR) repeat protein
MKVVALLGVVFLLAMLYHVTRRRSWREGFGAFNAGHVFLAAMIVGAYGALMIWNYRPLRYQLLLIYPFYGAAAVILGSMFRGRQSQEPIRVSWLWFILAAAVLTVPVYQLWDGLAARLGVPFTYATHKWWTILAAVGLAAAAGVLLRLRPLKESKGMAVAVRLLVVVVLVANAYSGLGMYYWWLERPTFTAEDISRDLGMALGDGAVLSGPYGPLLALENEHAVVIHMFGVAEPDPELFRRFPITHLLLDENNESWARNDYPELMDSAQHLLTYHLGTEPVRLFRIAGYTDNPRANAYRPTVLELAIEAYHEGEIGRGHALAAEYIEQHPENLSGYLAVGEVADAEGQFDLAAHSLAMAVRFSPTSYNLNSRLGQLYKDQYEATGNPDYRRLGMQYFEKAILYAPDILKLKQAYNELKTGSNFGAREG